MLDSRCQEALAGQRVIFLDVTIKDAAAYGLILTQGYGLFGRLQVSTPAMIRFGQMTEDELFVTAQAAGEGIRIENRSETDGFSIRKRRIRNPWMWYEHEVLGRRWPLDID